jgi:hypothetical protein
MFCVLLSSPRRQNLLWVSCASIYIYSRDISCSSCWGESAICFWTTVSACLCTSYIRLYLNFRLQWVAVIFFIAFNKQSLQFGTVQVFSQTREQFNNKLNYIHTNFLNYLKGINEFNKIWLKLFPLIVSVQSTLITTLNNEISYFCLILIDNCIKEVPFLILLFIYLTKRCHLQQKNTGVIHIHLALCIEINTVRDFLSPRLLVECTICCSRML